MADTATDPGAVTEAPAVPDPAQIYLCDECGENLATHILMDMEKLDISRFCAADLIKTFAGIALSLAPAEQS